MRLIVSLYTCGGGAVSGGVAKEASAVSSKDQQTSRSTPGQSRKITVRHQVLLIEMLSYLVKMDVLFRKGDSAINNICELVWDISLEWFFWHG